MSTRKRHMAKTRKLNQKERLADKHAAQVEYRQQTLAREKKIFKFPAHLVKGL